jgi:hypothetical protein
MDTETLRLLGEAIKVPSAVLGATVSFCWGVWTWRAGRRDKLQAEERESERLAEARRVEATRPFLEKQLTLYGEAALICAKLATDPTDDKARARFWELYWGELALVENAGVERAMVSFKNALVITPDDQDALTDCALEVAKACRLSLARSWGVEAWVSPDEASRRSNKPLQPTGSAGG